MLTPQQFVMLSSMSAEELERFKKLSSINRMMAEEYEQNVIQYNIENEVYHSFIKSIFMGKDVK